MSKIAFIFPGQGAQYVGMGKDFYEKYPQAQAIFQQAEEASGVPVRQICFEENDQIHQTEYTQIAMLTTEIAILEAVRQSGIEADYTAGLSLGEYGALAAARVMNLKDLFSLIRKRGIYMQNAYPEGGAMTAVLGFDTEKIEAICESTEGIVSVANYNCPGQIVITGEKSAVDLAAENLKAAGAKRCIPLKVSGPFHSALLEGAGKELAKALENVTVEDPKIPYVSNVTADVVITKEPIKQLLATQVSRSVKWQQSVEKMIAEGVDTFLEIGPGKTLTGFLKKINPEVSCVSIQTVEDLEKYVGK